MEARKQYLENLDKATQAAQVMRRELYNAYSQTESGSAEERFCFDLMDNAREIHRKLVERVNDELHE